MKHCLCIYIAGFLMMAAASPVSADVKAEILDHRVVALEPPQPARVLTLTLEDFDRVLTLQLEDNRLTFASLSPIQQARIHTGGNRYLHGEVTGIQGSWVRLSWVGGQWSGAVFDGRELFLLESAGNLAGALRQPIDPDTLVLYRLADLQLPGLSMAVPVAPMRSGRIPRGNAVRGPYQALPVTIVSDTQFTAFHGGNTASVVAARVNLVDGIYSAELGVGIALHHHRILVSNGPLTTNNAEDLLSDFRSYMNSGAGSSIPSPGLAHLFTGRDILDNDGGSGIAGIAYLGGSGLLCGSSYGYGVDEGTFSNTISSLLFAHELGHNFGAPHDGDSPCEHEADGRIMWPSIGPGTAHQFSTCSKQQMAAEINNATCLVDTALFHDRFEQ